MSGGLTDTGKEDMSIPINATYTKKVNIFYPEDGHPYAYASAVFLLKALEELAARNEGSYPNFGSFDVSAPVLFNFDISAQILVFVGCAPPVHLMPRVTKTARCVVIGERISTWASMRSTPTIYVKDWNDFVQQHRSGSLPAGHVVSFDSQKPMHELIGGLFYDRPDQSVVPGMELLRRSYVSATNPGDTALLRQAVYAAITRSPSRRSIAGLMAMASADPQQARLHIPMISGWAASQEDTIRSLVDAAVQYQSRSIRLVGINRSLEICQAPKPLAFLAAQAMLLRTVGKSEPLGISYYDTQRGKEFTVVAHGTGLSAGRVSELFPCGRGDDYVGYFRLPHVDSNFVLPDTPQ